MIIQGKVITYIRDNINTDEIIPARYLNTSDPDELANHLFRPERQLLELDPPRLQLREIEDVGDDPEQLPRRERDPLGELAALWIQRLVRQARTFLKPGGYLIFEIGDGQRDGVLAHFGRRWTEIETAWDRAGKPRVITARRA